MNDDGSARRELVDVSQVPSMEHLGDPSVQPNGTEVAFEGRWNQASYEQNHWGPAPGMCGGNCEGIYELINGNVSRITNAPFDCGAQPCESQETDPRVARDGSVAYVFQTWVSEMGGSGWMPIQGQSDLLARDGAGANQIRWPTVMRRDQRCGQGDHRRRRARRQSAHPEPDRLCQLPRDHQRRELRGGLDHRAMT